MKMKYETRETLYLLVLWLGLFYIGLMLYVLQEYVVKVWGLPIIVNILFIGSITLLIWYGILHIAHIVIGDKWTDK